ncbi:hypothetical protein HPP92_001467 [Vanilla planifolia]|uniref:C2H2-type domain-containing protein n=1 Tax=Vanilla planifolia TaxID=51239 RepID=A0A835RR52_VANPL|nr:hypothetical protein HPP92_001467 [Vanilla planifolia]
MEYEFRFTLKDIKQGIRIDECSICGGEFSPGQALGGHMRRHRQPPVAKKESLDLKLPAPSEGEQCYSDGLSKTPSVAFGVKRPILFSTPALVHCHY